MDAFVGMKLPGDQDGDGDGSADRDQRNKENEALKKVKFHSFTATPPSIGPFHTSTLEWNVTVPPPGDPPIVIGVFLDGTGVSPTGSTTVSPTFTKTFHLTAGGEFASKALGQTQVTVDFGGCQTQDDLGAAEVGQVVKTQIEKMFAGIGEMKLKQGGATVTLDNFKVTIAIPLEVEVPDWFNADMDVLLTFSLFARPSPTLDMRVVATLDNVSVDVSSSLLSNLLSLGCAAVVSAAIQKQAEVFVRNLMGPTTAKQLADAVQGEVDRRLGILNGAHPPHPFRLHSMAVSANGISFRFCPAP
jgi:hypothetical protein